MVSQDTEVECLYVALVHVVEEGLVMGGEGTLLFGWMMIDPSRSHWLPPC